MAVDIFRKIQYTPYVKSIVGKKDNSESKLEFPKINSTTAPISNTDNTDNTDNTESMTPTESVTTSYTTTPSVKKGNVVYKTEGIDVGKMQPLIDYLTSLGMNIRITSGVRPGAVVKSSGKPSQHGSGEAIDVTPVEGETFESLKEQMKKANGFVDGMKSHGYAILDETTPEMMAQTGATGPHGHFHVGNGNDAFLAKHGGVLKRQRGGGMDLVFDKDNQPRLGEGAELYQKQYSLPQGQGQGVIKQEYLNEPPKEDGHDKLYNFTKSYETFQPNTYEAEGQNLIGYGTADKAYVSRGTITEKEASDKMKADFDYIETRLKNRIKNWNKLSDGIKIAIMDIAYNGKGVENFIKNSPNLMGLLDSGVTDGRVLAKELNHSVTRGGGLQARARARQAMAAGDYDGDSESVDKHGRQTIAGAKPNPNDWYNSPYYNYTI